MNKPFLKLAVVSYFVLLTTSFNVVSSEVHDIPQYFDHNCTITDNFTSDSPYQFNLDGLLLSLYSMADPSTNTTTPEFYRTSTGSANLTEAVYGEYMCRGDVPMEVCQECIQDATYRIASECPNNKEATFWYDQCFLRYSHHSFFSTLHQLPTVKYDFLMMGVSEDEIGHVDLNKMLNDAVAEAATSKKKFATREANLTNLVSVYSLVQCTPDLSPQLCRECLYGLIKLIPTNFTIDANVYGGRILNPSCNMRYDDDGFYYKGSQPSNDYMIRASESPTLADWNCSTSEANYATHDPYLNNLRSLALKFNMSSNNTRFYSTIVGNKSDDTIYGLFMCRGDVSVELCHECVNHGLYSLNFECPYSKEAIIWFDMCMLRYSNRSFFSTLDMQPNHTEHGEYINGNQNDGFNRLLANTLHDLVVAATSKLSMPTEEKYFATKEASSPSEFRKLYTLAQCIPNLTSQDCQKCLLDAQTQISSCCLGRQGGQFMYPRCNLRFELYRFYFNNYNTSAVSLAPAYPQNKPPNVSLGITGKDNDHSRIIIIVLDVKEPH